MAEKTPKLHFFLVATNIYYYINLHDFTVVKKKKKKVTARYKENKQIK